MSTDTLSSKVEGGLISFASVETISYDRAVKILNERPPQRRVKNCPLALSLGRVLSIAVESECDLPLFDNSAVDGFAVCEEDRQALELGPIELLVEGTVYAGHEGALPTVRPGTTVHVLTGAPIPLHTSAIVMQEDVSATSEHVTVLEEIAPGRNVRRRGEECLTGSWLFDAGTYITPAVVGALAASGCREVEIFQPPTVGVLTTGSEIASSGGERSPFQIPDANGPALVAALDNLGLKDVRLTYSPDEPAAVSNALAELAGECDVILAVGGVSVGDRDLVRPALRSEGFETLVQGVAIRPGKPFFFGRKGDRVAFGLPGNPLSAMVNYLVFVQPYLRRMFGLPGSNCRSRAKLTSPVCSKIGLRHFVPGILSHDRFEPSAHRCSSMLSGFGQSNGLAVLPEETESARAEEEVEVLPIRWQACPL